MAVCGLTGRTAIAAPPSTGGMLLPSSWLRSRSPKHSVSSSYEPRSPLRCGSSPGTADHRRENGSPASARPPGDREHVERDEEHRSDLALASRLGGDTVAPAHGGLRNNFSTLYQFALETSSRNALPGDGETVDDHPRKPRNTDPCTSLFVEAGSTLPRAACAR